MQVLSAVLNTPSDRWGLPEAFSKSLAVCLSKDVMPLAFQKDWPRLSYESKHENVPERTFVDNMHLERFMEQAESYLPNHSGNARKIAHR